MEYKIENQVTAVTAVTAGTGSTQDTVFDDGSDGYSTDLDLLSEPLLYREPRSKSIGCKLTQHKLFRASPKEK